ncbi:MAG: hypothetical protein ACOCXJ_07960, partial [Planctomycetota bacterium]
MRRPCLVLIIIASCLVTHLSAADLDRPVPAYEDHQYGMQRCLIIPIRYQDREPKRTDFTGYAELAEENSEWLRKQSYFRTSMTYDIVPGFVEMEVDHGSLDGFGREWSHVREKLAEQYPQIDASSYTRLWMVNSTEKCGEGCAYLNNPRFAINAPKGGNTQHEIAHTYGLPHEYRPASGYDIGREIVPPTKIYWGWMRADDPDGFGYLQVGESGTYRIADYQSLARLDGSQRALYLPSPGNTEHAGYVLSHTESHKVDKVPVPRGVAIWLQEPSRNYSDRIDLEPETDDVRDGDVLVGDSYETDDGYWRIEVLSLTPAADGQPQWVEVAITLLRDLPDSQAPEEQGRLHATDQLIGFTYLGDPPQLSVGSPVWLRSRWQDADNDLSAYRLFLDDVEYTGDIVTTVVRELPEDIRYDVPWVPQEPGIHMVYAEIEDAAGNRVQTDTVTFEVIP